MKHFLITHSTHVAVPSAEFDQHYHAVECTGSTLEQATTLAATSTTPSILTTAITSDNYSNINTSPTFTLISNTTADILLASTKECHRDSSILYLLLMLGTLWIGVTLYNFTKRWVDFIQNWVKLAFQVLRFLPKVSNFDLILGNVGFSTKLLPLKW